MLSSPADAGLPAPWLVVPPSAVPAAPPCAVTVETESTEPVGPVTVVVVAPLGSVTVEVVSPPLLAAGLVSADDAALLPNPEIPLMMFHLSADPILHPQ